MGRAQRQSGGGFRQRLRRGSIWKGFSRFRPRLLGGTTKQPQAQHRSGKPQRREPPSLGVLFDDSASVVVLESAPQNRPRLLEDWLHLCCTRESHRSPPVGTLMPVMPVWSGMCATCTCHRLRRSDARSLESVTNTGLNPCGISGKRVDYPVTFAVTPSISR